MMKTNPIWVACSLVFLTLGCSPDSYTTKFDNDKRESDTKYVGQAVGNFSADEWYPAGRLGTTDNVTEGCYEDETPAVNEMGLARAFNLGEAAFERNFTINTAPFKGLGPAYLRTSCLDCHPGYGHGKRQDYYKAGFGNGYLLVVYHPVDGANSDDGPYVAEVTGMPQTKAVAPFLPPIDEDQIVLNWLKVDQMESGLPMTFPDGEKYELIYPELSIPESAFNTNPTPYQTGNKAVAFRLESTIGIIGTGLLDAIPEEDIKAQYQAEAPYVELNPAFWDKNANDFAATAWYSLAEGQFADGTPAPAGTKKLKRFTYAMTRASLQDGAGANAIWNITNVSRADRPYLYTTKAWAQAMSENAEVIAAIQADPASPYYADGTKEGIAAAVRGLLDPSTNQFDNEWYNFEPEMSDDQYYNFLVWHRGLSIPRARDLNRKEVQRGKDLFMEMGCASCHRPSWNTKSDNYWAPAIVDGKPLPRYENQTIWPYTDMIQHRLYMKNGIHGSWCRTTPLWGRGLSKANTGAEDRLHDDRARNVIEAIMWHGYSKQSDAYASTEKFYKLSKEDREAVVEFINAI
ncbi:MAG: c-type cytochrome [Bacteroidales bacterium]|nr:c-type cytochrome [Bacteroidales bacterium]